MCGIVGAVADREIGPILIEGLKKLEYRGYDSAGLALVHNGIIDNHEPLRQSPKRSYPELEMDFDNGHLMANAVIEIDTVLLFIPRCQPFFQQIAECCNA